jgi:hypothetical protein
MAEEWLTYKQLADRLGISIGGGASQGAEAALGAPGGQRRANTVHVQGDVVSERCPNVTSDTPPNVAPDGARDAATIKALKDHVETLKGEVERLKARAARRAPRPSRRSPRSRASRSGSKPWLKLAAHGGDA